MKRRGLTGTDEKAARLFERPAPPGYREEWARILAEPPEEAPRDVVPVIVFRVAAEWLALPCAVLREFIPRGMIHRVPHLHSEVLLGLTSVRGELSPAVSLRALLGMEAGTSGEERGPGESGRALMAVLVKDGEHYVAPVDEVSGFVRLTPEQVQPPPATVERGKAVHTRGVFELEGRRVALLDEELVFHDLKRRIV